MLGRLARSQPVEHGHPDERLRLLLDPRQKVGNLYRVPRRRRAVARERARVPRRQRGRARRARQQPRLGDVDREARADRGVDVVAAKRRRLAEHLGNAQAVVEEQAELPLVHLAAGVGDEAE